MSEVDPQPTLPASNHQTLPKQSVALIRDTLQDMRKHGLTSGLPQEHAFTLLDEIARLEEALRMIGDLSLSFKPIVKRVLAGERFKGMVVRLSAESPSAVETSELQTCPTCGSSRNARLEIQSLRRVIERHAKWREAALGFLHQVIDGRGTEDEWPALAEFIERSESRISEASPENGREDHG